MVTMTKFARADSACAWALSDVGAGPNRGTAVLLRAPVEFHQCDLRNPESATALAGSIFGIVGTGRAADTDATAPAPGGPPHLAASNAVTVRDSSLKWMPTSRSNPRGGQSGDRGLHPSLQQRLAPASARLHDAGLGPSRRAA